MADSRYVPGAEVIVSSLRRSVTQLHHKTQHIKMGAPIGTPCFVA
jgi:hypothetical protein